VAKSKNVKVNEVIWFPDRNFGRDSSLFDNEQERTTKAVILSGGWLDGCPVTVQSLSSEDKERAVAVLSGRWEMLKASQVETTYRMGGEKVVATASEVLRVFEQNFCSKGKVIAPEYEGIFAFQRGNALLDTMVLRFKTKLTGEYIVPVVVKEFVNHSCRVEECVLENTSKTSGLKTIDTHWPTLFKAVLAFWAARDVEGKAPSEAEVIRLISAGASNKRGTGGKVYGIVALHLRFPSLGIGDRVTDPKDGQSFGASLGQKEIREREIGTRAKVAEGSTPYAESDVEDYLADPKAGSVVIPNVPKRKDVLAFINGKANALTKYVVMAIYEADLTRLNKLESIAPQCNELLQALQLSVVTK